MINWTVIISIAIPCISLCYIVWLAYRDDKGGKR